ncbi:MAG TPA: hypothetical protein VEH10_01545 [Thermoplasmata archaeon]|nr:hypothetical protein [Thermoplasmata archaeon]
MAKALVVFNADHLETRVVAEEIARGMSGAGPVVATVASVHEVSAGKIKPFGIVVLGSPASSREANREARELTSVLPVGALDRKTVSVFDVGPAAHHGVGARVLREAFQTVDPGLHLASPGISVVLNDPRRELADEEVARCRQFGVHLTGMAVAAGRA